MAETSKVVTLKPRTPKKTAAKKVMSKKTAKPASKKAVAKKAATKTSKAKKIATAKATAKKITAKKPAAKPVAKKATAKKATTKKVVAKKTAPKKTAKKAAPKKAKIAARKTTAKPKAKIQAKVTTPKTSFKPQTTRKTTTTQFEKITETIMKQAQFNPADFTPKDFEAAQAQFDQFTKEASDINREGIDAFVKSGEIFAKGFESLLKETMSFAQSTAEKQMQLAKDAMTSKTINEFSDAQNKIAQTGFDDFMSGATKLTELSTKVLTEAIEPISDQIQKSVQKATDAVAAE